MAGWPYWLAEGLTSIGAPSENVIPEDSDFADLNRRLPHHSAVASKSESRARKFLRRASFLAQIPSRYSLIHYHGSHLLRGTMHHLLEGPYLSLRSVPMIVSFGGSDARIIELARRNNPYFYRDADPEQDERTRTYLRAISKYVQNVATDCEMIEYVAPYFERVFTFRQPLNLSRFQISVSPQRRSPVVLHVPTDTHVKGTEQIVAAVERLKAEGLQFEFKLVRQLAQKEFYRELSSCDIYVDELRCGSYGVTAVEAMAYGKPAITYLRPDLVEKYPSDLPLVNANPDTITDVLRGLIVDDVRRANISELSQSYVRKYHDDKVVAHAMLEVYKAIGLAKSET
ncbi:hypothetical protein PSQ19_17265 [Devosia algicola]|uniref:Glycosyltransferase family 1 protein n=1 Tax=Devosia algicola TaxID=3026418 RepID=A0ABY7YM12_9HYPH|nr:hypothetical protein [Devosia algicola]WDR02348.1 hypothetical protein PSQ19_17265 [Devosia algicola]